MMVRPVRLSETLLQLQRNGSRGSHCFPICHGHTHTRAASRHPGRCSHVHADYTSVAQRGRSGPNYRKAATRERERESERERACYSSPRHDLPCLFSIYYTKSPFLFLKLARHLSGGRGVGLRHARAGACLVNILHIFLFLLFRNVVVMNQGYTFRQTEDKNYKTKPNLLFPLPCSLPKVQNLPLVKSTRVGDVLYICS